MSDLYPPVRGVHFKTPLEYLLLQHPFWHWLLPEQAVHSPRTAVPVSNLLGVAAPVTTPAASMARPNHVTTPFVVSELTLILPVPTCLQPLVRMSSPDIE